MPNRLNLVGKRFGRLIVMDFVGIDKRKWSLWRCLCDCGKEKIILGRHLKTENVKSCGCLRKELNPIRRITHGHERKGKMSPTYHSWIAMKTRCFNGNRKDFGAYGARGISVCERWRNSFEAFLADIGKRPPGLTLQRIDNDLGYFPGNCKWATWKEQAANRRKPSREV